MAREGFEDEAGGGGSGEGGGGGGGDEEIVVTERLRQRTKRRPVYLEEDDDGMEDEEWEAHPAAVGEEEGEEEEEEYDDEDDDGRSVRKNEQSDDFCDKCNAGGDLLCCDTCPAVFHLGCLDPPMKVVPRGKWSCPKCADPLVDVEKFIDVQMRPVYVPVKVSEPVVDAADDEEDDDKASADQDGDKPPSSEQAAAAADDKTPSEPAAAAEKITTSDQGGDEASVSAPPPKEAENPPPPKLVKQYLIKWKSRSYLHCSWVTMEDLERGMKNYPGLRMKLNYFHKTLDASKNWNTADEDRMAIRPEWTTVDRVLDARDNDDGVTEYLIKWKELGYDEATWEAEEDISAFQAEVEKFKEIMSRQSAKKRKGPALDQKDLKRRRRDFKPFKKTPKFLVGGSLHPYQLEGLNFLRFAWEQNKHVILADEMGLGKTIQSIALLASLIEANTGLPHLVVAPLSTLRNWEREFATWAPQMNVVMYVGSSQARTTLREYEFFFPKSSRKRDKGKRKSGESKQDRVKFDVLLTSYEMINIDTHILKALKWECLVVDEGHRLKNKDSKLFQTLTTFSTHHRVLLTGTPLQNNLDELFMLMHFLDAGKFGSLEEFQQEFQDINQEEQVGRLHKMLAPHLLRRVKKDVLKEMPPKKELILRVELSTLQKEFYKAILTKNYQILSRQGGAQVSLTNVVMELRKLCGHPYLLDGVEPDVGDQAEANRQLLENSGKLVLLDKMMTKLHAQGHRVLIYSQFTRMLDILEDWLNIKMWGYERIDGKISGSERQIRIDRYNAPGSTKFCFLLSTRAGGLGINLATADTVIIYDSDWNPHADLQAMARAHRLGQQNKVMIFRLVTRGTIEERMMQMTKKKMVLEHLVVGRMKKENINQEELDDILRYGAMELFSEKDEEAKARQIHYDDAAIDRLLDRAQVTDEEVKVEDEEDNDLLKAFKVANFDYIDEEAAATAAAAAEEAEREARAKLEAEMEGQGRGRAQFWDTLLKDRVEEAQVEEIEELGKGKRSRRTPRPGLYSEENDLAGMNAAHSDDEQEPNNSPVAEPNSPDYHGNTGDVTVKRQNSSKKRARTERVTGEPPPLIEGEGRELRVLGFNHKQRTNFVNVLLRFGLGDFTWSEFVPRLRPKTPEEIKEYGTLFLSHIAEDINATPFFSDGVPKEGLRIQDVLVRLAILHLMRDKCKVTLEEPGMLLFRGGEHMYRFYSLRNTKVWKEEHDKKLLFGICQKHGYGRWLSIVEDPHLGLGPVIRSELLLRGVSDSAGPSKNGEARPGEMEADPPGHEEGKPGFPFGGDKEDKENHFQKRMVDFVKRRVLVLEKVLNAEYHSTGRFPPLPDIPHPGTPNQGQEQQQEPPPQVEPVMRSHQPSHERSHDPGMRAHQSPQEGMRAHQSPQQGMRGGYQAPQMAMNDLRSSYQSPQMAPGMRSIYQAPPQMMTADPMFRHQQMMSGDVGGMRAHQQQQPQYFSPQTRPHRPVIHPVPITQEEIAANMYDNDEGRIRVAQIYNQICGTVTENEGDAIQAYSGNMSAGLRVRKALREVEIFCLKMRDVLFEPTSEGGAAADQDGGGGAPSEEEDNSDDVECEVAAAAAESRRQQAAVPHEYQFLKIPTPPPPPPHGTTPFVFLDS